MEQMNACISTDLVGLILDRSKLFMDFAKEYLSKYGWQEGGGIGKNATGIAKPIRANLKFDTTGLSFDKAKELTNPWWEKVFDNAAENLNVHDTSFSVNSSEKTISVNGSPVVNLKSYEGYFQKGHPDIKHDCKQEEEEESSNLMSAIRPINDEDLLKACGGRTAHKGARHGLTLSGKLSRIVAQEKQLLNENEINTGNAQNIFQTWIQVKKRKHRVKECTQVPNATDAPNKTDTNHLDGLINQEDYQSKRISKKKKKQQRIRDEDLAKSLSRLSTSNNSVDSDRFKFYGVQSSSKVIKKEKLPRKSHSDRKTAKRNKEHHTNGRSAKQSDGITLDGHYASSDDSEKDIRTDPMVSQIQEIMSQYPNKKFKVEAKELTSFQKKQLQKSGLRIEFKSKKREKKSKKDFIQVERIIKKMKNSMDFHNSEK